MKIYRKFILATGMAVVMTIKHACEDCCTDIVSKPYPRFPEGYLNCDCRWIVAQDPDGNDISGLRGDPYVLLGPRVRECDSGGPKSCTQETVEKPVKMYKGKCAWNNEGTPHQTPACEWTAADLANPVETGLKLKVRDDKCI